jgi:hypothetical protein
VDSFLGQAEQILETAAAASETNSPEYVICVSRTGSIRILSDVTGWSLPALAIELGAAALYQVGRDGTGVRVEGWSYGRKCLLSREPSHRYRTEGRGRNAYATMALLESGGACQNDRGPHVRNS